MTKYSSATEALKEIVYRKAKDENEKEAKITKLISPSSGQLSNGIDYCFVEVTCENGVQYGIPAYGKEAEELYRLAMRYLSKTEREKELFLGCLVSARS